MLWTRERSVRTYKDVSRLSFTTIFGLFGQKTKKITSWDSGNERFLNGRMTCSGFTCPL